MRFRLRHHGIMRQQSLALHANRMSYCTLVTQRADPCPRNFIAESVGSTARALPDRGLTIGYDMREPRALHDLSGAQGCLAALILTILTC